MAARPAGPVGSIRPDRATAEYQLPAGGGLARLARRRPVEDGYEIGGTAARAAFVGPGPRILPCAERPAEVIYAAPVVCLAVWVVGAHLPHGAGVERTTIYAIKDGLIETYASLVPAAIDALGSEERHRVYKIMGLKALLGADGALELSGDIIGFPKNGISLL